MERKVSIKHGKKSKRHPHQNGTLKYFADHNEDKGAAI